MIPFSQKRRWGHFLTPNATFLVLSTLFIFGGVLPSHAQLSLAFNIVHVQCGSSATGEVTALVSGGSQPYRYLWSTGDTVPVIRRLRPGNYTVTVTDAVYRTAVSTATVNGEPPINVTIATIQNCSGPATVVASATGGTAPYRYAWDMGTFSSTATITTTGKFCVTVTDAKLCGRIECVEVSVEPLVALLTTKGVTCPDGTDGTVTSSITGGVPPYQYQWSNGATTPNLTGVAGGSYRLTVTDAKGCTTTALAIVSAPPAFVALLNAVNPSCPGTSNGSIQILSITGGTPSYQIQWNTGQTQPTLSGLPSGQYTLTIRDLTNCVTTRDIVLAPRSNLQIATLVTNETCPGQNNGTISVQAQNGLAPYSYSWNPNGSSSAVRTNLAPRTYQVTVTDAAGCQRTGSGTVAAAVPFSISLSKTDVTSCTQQNGSASVAITGGVGPFTYFWNNGLRTQSISNLSAGIYSVTVADAAGCTQAASIQLFPPPSVSVQVSSSPQLCAGLQTGFVTATPTAGTAPFSYSWNTGATTQNLTNVGPATYRVTVTDANNCSATGIALIAQVPKPEATVNASGIVCGGLNIGSAQVTVSGGTPSYAYQWSTGSTTSTLSNLGSGVYTVTVTDANNCRDTAQGVVDIVPQITFIPNVSNVLCNGAATGVAGVTVGGGRPTYSYRWNNGATSAQIVGVQAGTYTVTVTDAVGCTGSSSLTVTQPTAVNLTLTRANVACGNISTSWAQANPTGGTAPYTYTWSNNGSTQRITALPGGTYSVTVADANGCANTGSVVVSDPGALNCTIEALSIPSGPAQSDGAATATITGGVAPYSYFWTNGATTDTVNNLGNNEYNVTIQDANGCITSCGVSITLTNALVGDCVWFDINQNGLQDPGEKGIPDIEVIISPIGFVANFPEPKNTRTNSEGKYKFLVPPGTYKITFVVPDTLQLTRENNPLSETLDSDADRETGMTATFQVEAGKSYLTWDAGMIPPARIIPSLGCFCLDNATTAGNGQFSEQLGVQSLSGENWRIIGQSGMYLRTSPAPPAAPLPVPIGTALTETSPGVYSYPFRHIDGEGYDVTLTNGIDTLALENVCYYPKVKYGSLPNVYCFNDAPQPLALTATVPGTISYTINNLPVSSIQPQNLAPGFYNLVVRVAPTNPAECDAVEIFPFQIAANANCDVKLGDFVWEDTNNNGIQDGGEAGIPNVQVFLRDPDRPGINLDTVVTDASGRYCFFTKPGNYQVLFKAPVNSRYEPTSANIGTNDSRDSDMDPVSMLTGVFALLPGVNNLTIDAGFILGCDNVTDPGLLGYDQVLCGPGADPAPIQSLRLPSGGTGDLEYVWMISYIGEEFNSINFEALPNSNSPTYDPGPLQETAYFVRCVRRAGCGLFKEPPAIKITVENKALAKIISSPNYCLDNPINLRVETKTENASVKWELFPISGNVQISPRVAYGKIATFISTTTGQVQARVTVTENGCTLVQTTTFNITTSPVYCTTGNALSVTGLMDEAHQVNLRWRMRNDVFDYTFNIEHAPDGTNWQAISDVTTMLTQEGDYRYYEYSGKAMNNGRNFYRVKADDGFGNELISNVITLAVKPEGTQQLAHAYPNPVSDFLVLDILKDVSVAETTQIELIQSNGATLRKWALEPGKVQDRIDCRDLPAGLYFVRVQVGASEPAVLKVIKEQN